VLIYHENALVAHRGPSRARFAALLRLALPFLAGVVLPIAVFLIPYIMSGSVGDVVRGVFIKPTLRLTYAAMPPLSWRHGASALGVIALLIAARRLPARQSVALGILVAAVGGYLVLISATSPSAYRSVFHAAALLPIATVIAAALIVGGVGQRTSVERQRVMIVGAALATFMLVQFPFAAPIYFCYITPLLALGALAVIRDLELSSPAVPAALFATFAAFAVVRMNPGFLYNLGVGFARYEPLAPIAAPRGGYVRVPSPIAAEYSQLVALVREHAGSDSGYIYAAPDAPEIYFLTGLRNPTRTMYDFFDDPEARTSRVLASLQAHDVRVVAINKHPEFSSHITGDLLQTLQREYPVAVGIGDFEVRWRQ
jgi:hypothetical protein